MERDRPYFPFARLKQFAPLSRVAPLARTPLTFRGIEGAIAVIGAIEPTPPEFSTPLGPVHVSYRLSDDVEAFEEVPLRLALSFRPQSMGKLAILERHIARIEIGSARFSLLPAGSPDMRVSCALTLAAGGAAEVDDADLKEQDEQEHVVYLPFSEAIIRQVRMTITDHAGGEYQ
jgi:hypothetical protein